MALPHLPRMTAEEFLVAPGSDRDFRQLIDGVVVVSQPMWRHQRVVGLLHARLLAWVETTGSGVVGLPVDMVLDRYNVYAPDVWWLSDPARLDPDQVFHGTPDLAIEVRSPSTWRYDRGVKRLRYARSGLAELWLVDTKAESVLACRRSSPRSPLLDVEAEFAADDRLRSALLPGFDLAVRELFPA